MSLHYCKMNYDYQIKIKKSMIIVPQVFFWKFYSRGKLACTKTFCFVISTKEFICKIYYYHDVLYLSWLSKAVWTKIWKCDWKQGTGKNNNNTDINTTRNCAFGKNRFSDTNSTLLGVQFEKTQTKRITFLWKKSSPTHESPFNFKNWSGKSD